MHRLLTIIVAGITLTIQPVVADSAVAHDNLQAIAKLDLQYQQSTRRFFPDDVPDFGKYLGTGNGSISGSLIGSVGWDLYEDWEFAAFHPTLFKGVITIDEQRIEYTMQGVFTPYREGGVKYWRFSGFFHIHDLDYSKQHFGYQVLPVHGRVKEGEWSHEYFIYKPW